MSSPKIPKPPKNGKPKKTESGATISTDFHKSLQHSYHASFILRIMILLGLFTSTYLLAHTGAIRIRLPHFTRTYKREFSRRTFLLSFLRF